MDFSILMPGFLAAGCWISLAGCIKKKKIYSEDKITVLSGQVLSWSKHKEPWGRSQETYYDIEVFAEDGETYNISTPSRKARKYKNMSNINIVVPVGFKKSDDADIYKVIEENGEIDKLSDEDLNKLNEIRKMQNDIKTIKNNISSKVIRIEEDSKFTAEFWLSLILGIIFTVLELIIIINV